jgi:membrane protein insertase Oxa1/YidC/SpoIIIJ
MTEQTASQYRTAQQDQPSPPRGATGLTTFAGVMMIMAGGFQVFNGLVALLANEFYVNTPNYLFKFDATSWGWIHLLVGLLVLLAGFAVLAGQTWGRVIGIVLAVLSALANFAFIPYYPFWSLTIIALDILVIWALAAHGRDVTR